MLIILILGWMGGTFITTKICSIIKKFLITCFLYNFFHFIFLLLLIDLILMGVGCVQKN